MRFLIASVLFFSIHSLSGQPSWTKIYGGSEDNRFMSICKSNDGGYLAAGYTQSFGAMNYPGYGLRNIYLVKTDSLGNFQWQRAVDLISSSDEGFSMVQTPNGDIFIIGQENNNYGYEKIFLAKLNSTGNLVWYQFYGGSQSNIPGRLVNVSNDVVVTGTIEDSSGFTNVWLARINNAGASVWEKFYNTSNNEKGYSICNVHDGGFLLCGQRELGTGSYTPLVIRTNSMGDSLWTRTVPAIVGPYHIGFWGCAELQGDSVFALTGSAPSTYGHLVSVKMNMNGDVTKIYTSQFLSDVGIDVKPLDDGGFIVVGGYANFGAVAALYRFSANGTLLWTKRYFYFGALSYHTYSFAGDVEVSYDGGFVIAGLTSLFGDTYYKSKALVMKTDEYGNAYAYPSITPAVTNDTLCAGSTSVVSVPDNYDHYQWFWINNSSNVYWIPDSDTSVITVDSSRSYRCAMWNEDGSVVLSNFVQVIVSTMPDTVISVNGALSYCPPTSVYLRVKSEPGSSYQWFFNGTLMNGFSSYYLNNPQISGNYAVQITNACSTIVTPSVKVTVGGPPKLDIEPDTAYLPWYFGGDACDPVELSFNNSPSITSLQWFHNGDSLPASGYEYDAYENGYYYVKAQNSCGIGYSDTVYVVYDTIFSPLFYHIPTPSLTGCANETLRLYTNTYDFNLSLWFQWYKNGTLVYSDGYPWGDSYNPGTSTPGLDTGYYYCRVFAGACDGNGDYQTDSVYYAEDNSSRNVTIQGGSSISCNGSPITVTANQLNASYQWYQDSVLIPGATSQSYSVTTTGTYMCEITRICGTYFSFGYLIIIGPLQAVITSDAGALCRTSIDTTEVRLSNQINSNWGHQWRYFGVNIPGANYNIYETNLPGVYDCLFYSPCDTIVSNSITLPDYFIPEYIIADPYGRMCKGDTVNLHATAGYTYQWYERVSGYFYSLIPGATDSILAADSSTSYYALISNGQCSIQSEYEYIYNQNPPLPNNIMAASPVIYCDTTGAMLIANQRPDLQYQWYNNLQPIPGAVMPQYMASSAGSYQVMLIDSVNCSTISDPQFINNNVLSNVTLSTGNTANVCNGVPITISLNGTYQTYQWLYNGVPIVNATGSSLLTDSAGVYTVDVSDSINCNGSASVIVGEVQSPLDTMVVTIPASCQAATGQITVYFNTMVSCSWSGPTNINNSQGITAVSASNLLAGWYYLTFENYGGGCTVTDSILVDSIPTIYLNINSGNGSICQGQTINAGAVYAQYLWSTGATTYFTTPQSTGWYILTVTEPALGCSGTDSAFITVNTLPTVNISFTGPPVVCTGTSIFLDAGSGFSQYMWSTGASTQTIAAMNNGTYIVTVTDPVNGCMNKDTVVLGSASTPLISLNPSGSISLCQGDSVTISVTSGYATYLWSDGSTGTSITTNLAGTYAVTVIDSTGYCSVTDAVQVTVTPLPSITAIPSGPTSFCAGDSVELSISGSIGIYEWYRYSLPIAGSTASVLIVKSRGLYRCHVTDQFGCTAYSNSILVSVPCVPPLDPVEKEVTEISNDKESITIYPNPGTGSYEIRFSNGLVPVDISVHDLSGRMVEASETPAMIDQTRYSLNLHNLNSGNYIVSIKGEDFKLHHARLIKQ